MIPVALAECIEILLNANANIEAEDEEGRSPLLVAAESGNTEMVKFLIEKGASVNHHNRKEHSPMFLAALGHFLDTIMVLKESGGVFTSEDIFTSITIDDCALLDIMKIAGADFTIQDHEGNTCLHGGVWGSRKEVLKWLLDNATSDIDVRNRGGATPLHEAARWGCLETVRILLQRGACVNSKTYQGSTPLHWALSYEEHEIANYIRSLGGLDEGE